MRIRLFMGASALVVALLGCPGSTAASEDGFAAAHLDPNVRVIELKQVGLFINAGRVPTDLLIVYAGGDVLLADPGSDTGCSAGHLMPQITTKAVGILAAELSQKRNYGMSTSSDPVATSAHAHTDQGEWRTNVFWLDEDANAPEARRALREALAQVRQLVSGNLGARRPSEECEHPR